MSNLGKYTKAIVGAIIAGLSALQVAQADNVITQQEWITVAVAFVTALGVVWGVPNKPDSQTAQTLHVAADEPIVLSDHQEP